MATGLRPASSNLAMIFPITPDCSASGFKMLNVRSSAIGSAPVEARLDSRLEADGQGSEKQLDVVVGEVEAGAHEVIAAADDAGAVHVVHDRLVQDVVRAEGQEDVIEEPVVRVQLHARMVLERVGELERIRRKRERVVEEVELDPEAARVLQDAEPAAEG